MRAARPLTGRGQQQSLEIGRFFEHMQIYCWVKTYPFWLLNADGEERWALRVDLFGGAGWTDSHLVVTCREDDGPGRRSGFRFFEFRGFCQADDLPPVRDEARTCPPRFKGLVRRDIRADRAARADYVGYVSRQVSTPLEDLVRSLPPPKVQQRGRWEDVPRAIRRTTKVGTARTSKRSSVASVVPKSRRRSSGFQSGGSQELKFARWMGSVLLDAESEDEEGGEARPKAFSSPKKKTEFPPARELVSGRRTQVKPRRDDDDGYRRRVRVLETELADERHKNNTLETSNLTLKARVEQLERKLMAVSAAKDYMNMAQETGKLRW